jgi:hypothetical protein
LVRFFVRGGGYGRHGGWVRVCCWWCCAVGKVEVKSVSFWDMCFGVTNTDMDVSAPWCDDWVYRGRGQW